ncbi:MAG TPA: TIGR02757 family protein [Thermoanaerobaculia bacterium]|nr:TIGR02757 family protein [Thermoanaerobaculia bacterium]
MRKRPVGEEVLRDRLDQLVAAFDLSTIEPDPLQLVRRYTDSADVEVAGLLAASFAYGRADIIVRNIGEVLDRMEPSPSRYLLTFSPAEASRRFRGFSHRFHKTRDLVALMERAAWALRTHGSLGALFRECDDPADRDVAQGLARFADRLFLMDDGAAAVPSRLPAADRSLRYLLTSPADGSACKRMNLFLRWMVRRTSPDMGLWTFVDPSRLVIPLDTHVHRITTFLGLATRRTPDWKAARAVTDRLARFDPADPVRYDFAICRLGILDRCSRKRQKENCDLCLLRDACRFPVT